MPLRTRNGWNFIPVGTILCVAAFAAERYPRVPFPEGYRQWTFLHGTVIGPDQGVFARKKCEAPCTSGIMYFYGNQKAMEGFRAGKFQDGSVVANETLEMHGTEDGGAAEGPRVRVAVMVKNAKLYEATGGWGYAEFLEGSNADETTAEKKTACVECHGKRKDQDYVFTVYQER